MIFHLYFRLLLMNTVIFLGDYIQLYTIYIKQKPDND